MVKCRCRRFAEVPIEFTDRIAGESKLTVGQQLLYLRQLCGLYWFRFPVAVVALTALVLAIVTWRIAT